MMSHDHFVTFASLFLTWPIYSSLDIGISRYTQTMFIHNFLECKPIKEVSNWCIVCNILAERLIPHIMSNTNEIYREFQSFFFFLHKKCNEFQSFVFFLVKKIVMSLRACLRGCPLMIGGVGQGNREKNIPRPSSREKLFFIWYTFFVTSLSYSIPPPYHQWSAPNMHLRKKS